MTQTVTLGVAKTLNFTVLPYVYEDGLGTATLGTPEVGSAPATTGTWASYSGQVGPSVGANEAAVGWATGTQSYTFCATINTIGSDSGLIVRVNVGGSQWWMIYYGAGTYQLHSRIGSYTLQQSSGVTAVVGDYLEVSVTPTNISCVRNNTTQILNFDTTSVASNTSAGFRENFTTASRYSGVTIGPLNGSVAKREIKTLGIVTETDAATSTIRRPIVHTPGDLGPSLKLWLRAKDLALANGATVTTWPDQSGNGFNGTGVGTPTYQTNQTLTGGPIVRTNGGYFSFANIMGSSPAGEVLIWLKSNDTGGNGLWTFGSDLGSSTHYAYSGTIYDTFGTASRQTVGSPVLAITNFRCYNVWSAPSDFGARLDNSAQFSTGSNTVGWTSAPKLGYSVANGLNFIGDIAEIILVDRKLSTPERTALYAYMRSEHIAKMGLPTEVDTAYETKKQRIILGVPKGGYSPWASTILASGSSVWARLDETTGGTGTVMANSQGTAGRDGSYGTILTPAASLMGNTSGAQTFNATSYGGLFGSNSGYMNVANFTASIIMKKASAPGSIQLLINRWATDLTGHRMFTVAVDTAGKPVFTIANTAGTGFATTGPTSICDGRAHLVTVQRTSGVGTLYVDGVLVGTTATTTGTVAGPSVGVAIDLGGNSRNGIQYYAGDLDEFVFWNSSISLTAIFAAYFAGGELSTANFMTKGPPKVRIWTKPTETDIVYGWSHYKRYRPDALPEIDNALAILRLPVYGSAYSSAEDITGDSYVPGDGILYANTAPGEYVPAGEVATQWFTWTSGDSGPAEVTFSFTFSGQTGSGGASLRVYNSTVLMPGSGDIVDQTNINAASGNVIVTFNPAPNTTYSLQRGIQEKAGAVGPLLTSMQWSAPLAPGSPTFYYPTPVIP